MIFLISFANFSVALADEEKMCSSIKDLIIDGHDTVLVVQAAIDLGWNPCMAVKCAYRESLDMERVIHGAFLANTSPDVVTGCLMEAGVDGNDINGVYAKRDAMGEDYSPYGVVEAPATVIGLPGGSGSGSGGIISPF